MNREQYMSRLIMLLQDLPKEERVDALMYYQNYFEDAGAENEQQAIEALGSPEEVAARIKENLRQESANQDTVRNPIQSGSGNTYSQDNKQQRAMNTNRGLWIAVIILGFPIWFPLLITGFALAFSFLIVVFSLALTAALMVLGFFAGGVLSIIIGIGRLALMPSVGIWTIGGGLIMLALGVLSIYLCSVLFGRTLPACAKWISGLWETLSGKFRRQAS